MSQDDIDPNGVQPPAADGTPESPAGSSPLPPSAAAPSRRRWILASAAAVGVALFAVPLLRGPDLHPSHPAGTGSPAAGAGACSTAKGRANLDFTLKDIDGKSVRLADYKGKVILLNFWATWCGPCRLEIPAFVEAYQAYRDRGFVILGVLSEDDSSKEDLRAFMGEFEMNYPVLREDAAFTESFGDLWALPTSFVIDRHGTICTKHMGAVSREMLEREIKGLL